MNSDVPIEMLDMSAYMRQHMSAKALKRHIWYDEGGDSLFFLERILVSNVEFIDCFANSDISMLIEEHGPALIRGFRIESEFYDFGKWQHVGRRKNESQRLHAMILVGFRKEKDDKRFLLQNWWKEKPFVEVDAEYINSCRATIHFVKTDQKSIDKFITNIFDHVECDLIDSPEKTRRSLKLRLQRKKKEKVFPLEI